MTFLQILLSTERPRRKLFTRSTDAFHVSLDNELYFRWRSLYSRWKSKFSQDFEDLARGCCIPIQTLRSHHFFRLHKALEMWSSKVREVVAQMFRLWIGRHAPSPKISQRCQTDKTLWIRNLRNVFAFGSISSKTTTSAWEILFGGFVRSTSYWWRMCYEVQLMDQILANNATFTVRR